MSAPFVSSDLFGTAKQRDAKPLKGKKELGLFQHLAPDIDNLDIYVYIHTHTHSKAWCVYHLKKNKQNNCVCDVYIRGWRQHRVCNVFVSSSLFVCIVIKDGTEVVSWNYIDGHLTDATGSIYRVHSVNASRETVRSDGEHSFCAELGGVLSWLIWPTRQDVFVFLPPVYVLYIVLPWKLKELFATI